MRTIGIAELKAHLSRELRRVTAGETIVVTDHSQAIALLSPIPRRIPVFRPAARPLELPEIAPLIASDPVEHLSAERTDR